MLSIRRATTEDLPFLERVEEECFNDPWNINMLKDEVEANNTTYSLFLLNGEPIGYYSYLHIFDEAHIMNVAVLPQYQGMGYGSKMMDFLLEESLQDGLPNVTLEVRRGNERAIRLYEKKGFLLIGARPRYYMDGEDALIYWLYRN